MDRTSEAKRKELVANRETLKRIFIMREDDSAKATLLKYMEQIFFGLQDFLRDHVGITEQRSLREMASRFQNSLLSEQPEKKLAEVITELVDDIAPHAVNVASPYFVGHMTSAMPFFMVHLATFVAALNQNVVKLETSKIVSIVEKQLLAKIHRMIYHRDDDFYSRHIQSVDTSLGGFTEDGTLANMTALWVARNRLLHVQDSFGGVEQEGMFAAYRALGIERMVVLVSQLGHYSLRKAAGLLGLGSRNIIGLPIDSQNRVNIDAMAETIQEIKNDPKTRIMAMVGIAGATETGSIDPLPKLAELCAEHDIHFHVDAAWGGPTLFSEKYKHLLNGIELADSVTIDGHKQFYMPMTCGMVYFKNPWAMDAIAYHSSYIARPGSVDLGIRSLAGSRASNSLILDSALKIMGTKGYGILIEHGIGLAKQFAKEIDARPSFELITRPELNILTYRYVPAHLQEKIKNADPQEALRINQRLNALNIVLQRDQREAGKSFVSRTTLRRSVDQGGDVVVLRTVLMNPMTRLRILREILDEQENICKTKLSKAFGAI
ncbi:MAG: putative pyridoxal-dependent aspartate 1-decarboxylase [Desulfatibacillum sp.]|nr:putative pyridoxal-dependent aspartate 1-decarboxylase [Desulfatibacillum sp.]